MSTSRDYGTKNLTTTNNSINFFKMQIDEEKKELILLNQIFDDLLTDSDVVRNMKFAQTLAGSAWFQKNFAYHDYMFSGTAWFQKGNTTLLDACVAIDNDLKDAGLLLTHTLRTNLQISQIMLQTKYVEKLKTLIKNHQKSIGEKVTAIEILDSALNKNNKI